MKAREEMPLLRCALGPTGRPFGDGLHSVTASGTDGRKAVITRNWDMAGSTLKKPIRGRKMGVGAEPLKSAYLIFCAPHYPIPVKIRCVKFAFE